MELYCRGTVRSVTYADEERGQRGDHGHREEERDHLGRALRVGAEDVMDLGLLAVSEGLLVGRRREGRVRFNLDLEDGRVEALRRTERGEDDRRLERRGRREELDREVFLGLRQHTRQQ